jgi:hypothetical protein
MLVCLTIHRGLQLSRGVDARASCADHFQLHLPDSAAVLLWFQVFQSEEHPSFSDHINIKPSEIQSESQYDLYA